VALAPTDADFDRIAMEDNYVSSSESGLESDGDDGPDLLHLENEKQYVALCSTT
jgi:hypothetical protein